MQSPLCKIIFVAAISIAFATAWPQTVSPVRSRTPHFDLITTYDEMRAQSVGGSGFWMSGGRVEIHAKVHSWLGVSVQASGQRTGAQGVTPGLDLYWLSAGPRITETRRDGHWEFFLQVLAGEARGAHSIFPCGINLCTTASSIVAQPGYGVDMRLSRRLLIRIAEMDWVHTQFANAQSNTQNSLRISSGVVFRFGEH
jgi:peptidoglycan-associated lipoprotein